MAHLVNTVVAGRVATVAVANPPVNALADPVLEALGEAAASLAADPGVRAVVLTGAGERSFVAGADLHQLAAALGDAEAMEAHVALTRRVFTSWEELAVPLVAAIGGHATGGGLELALLCDFVVADPAARLGLPEVTLGLIPGAGGTQRLPRRVGRATAARMLLLGELVEAAEARAAGLVDVVSAPGAALASGQALAARLAALPAGAVSAAKRALRAAERGPLEEGLALERQLFLAVAATDDAREGVASFIDKREPRFRHG